MPSRKVKTEFELTGEEKLKRAIAEINNGTKVLNSEMRKLTAEYDGNTNSAEFLSKKYDFLERLMLSQKDKVDQLKKGVVDAANAYGEADARTQSWIVKLNDAEAAFAKTRNEMEDIDGVKNFGDVLDDVADKLGIKIPDSLS